MASTVAPSSLAAEASETDSDTEVEVRTRGDLRALVVGFELEIGELRGVSAQACRGSQHSSNTPA